MRFFIFVLWIFWIHSFFDKAIIIKRIRYFVYFYFLFKGWIIKNIIYNIKTFHLSISILSFHPIYWSFLSNFCRQTHQIMNTFLNQHPTLQSPFYRKTMESQFRTLKMNYRQYALRISQHPPQLLIVIFAKMNHKLLSLFLSVCMQEALERDLKVRDLNFVTVKQSRTQSTTN